MWKDFFYYSKSERRAVWVLLTLIALLLLIIQNVPERRGRQYVASSAEDSVELTSFLAGIQEQEKPSKKKMTVPESKKILLTKFDPNTVDSIELIKLGLSPFVASNVVKYRHKGGRFLTPESFSRIYGLEKEQFEALKPYISIESSAIVKKDALPSSVVSDSSVRKFIPVYKYPVGTLVDVGLADTTELKKIPGIGTVISRRIVGYRKALGGFYDLSQLRELDCITTTMMEWFKLEPMQLQKIPINKVGLDRLRSHPYINFYQARVIVEHRKKRGKIESLSQLSLYEEFVEKDLERLSHYLTFD